MRAEEGTERDAIAQPTYGDSTSMSMVDSSVASFLTPCE